LRPAAATKPSAPIREDDSAQDESDVKALYDAVNDLPSDDPLRTPPQKTVAPAQQPADSAANAKQPSQGAGASPPPGAQQPTSSGQPATQTVTVSDGNRLRVPSLLGLPVRKVIEQAAAAGLEVQIVGNGTARQQAPDPGTMVAPGTKIVVRCEQ
jgi:cell division protein FtsI (penicillin-binding protein 3)